MNIPAPWKGLLQSRKFWMAAITAVVAAVLYVQGAIPAETLADALTALAALVIGGIALEDAAAKYSGDHVTQKVEVE